ncbi:MAG: cupredoxin domain-containing protein [Telluria sp.]
MKRAAASCAALAAAGLALAAYLPLPPVPRDQLFDIPRGTWERHRKGDRTDVLPQKIYLTLGRQDTLRLHNSDTVPQTVGPLLIMPGQEFRMPFETESENQFDCTAHSSGQLAIIVEGEPTAGWKRLAWRVRRAYRSLFHA